MSGIAKAYIVGRIKEILPKRWGTSSYLQVVIEIDPVAETVAMVKVPEKQIEFYRKHLGTGCTVWIDGTYESLPGAKTGGYYNQVVAWRTGKIMGRKGGRKTGKPAAMPVSELDDEAFIDEDGLGFGEDGDAFDDDNDE